MSHYITFVRHHIKVSLLILTLCAGWNSGYATGTPAPGSLFITAYRNDSLTATVSDSTLHEGDPDYACSRKFLFATYPNENVKFYPSYAIPPSGQGTWYLGIFDQSNNLIDSGYYTFYSDTHLTHSFDTPGLYTLKFITTFGIGQTDTVIKCQILVIPKIQSVWIEADPICEDWTPAQQQNDGKFHFKIKTKPDLDSVMRFINAYTIGGTYPSCHFAEAEALSFYTNAGVTIDPHTNGNETFIYRKYSNPLPFGQNADLLDVEGSIWNATHYPYPNDYYMFYAHDSINPGYYVLKDFLSGGALYGNSLYVNVHIFDGIDPNGWLISAPVLIGQQYHLDDYIVTGNETWTPENNPATALYGGTQSELRIRNSLTINPGATLTIDSMNIEFGPDAWVTVKTGDSASNVTRGRLITSYSSLTALHTCGNDSSMWNGVIVEGKPYQSQETYYNGRMDMGTSTLSYAKKGVQLWDQNLEKEGGILVATDCIFKRNSTSVTMGPYHNISPLTHSEIHNESSFHNCDFVADTILPQSFSYFIGGWDVKGVNVLGCRFSHTASTAPTGYGIYGVDMGLNIDQGTHTYTGIPPHTDTFASSFYNLNKGVYLSTVTHAASLKARHTTFDQNFEGIHIDNVMAAEMKYDSFKVAGVPKTVPPTAPYPLNTGAAIYTSSGYIVHDDVFVQANPYSKANIGVLAYNTGSNQNLVHNNGYYDMGTGNLSNFKNRGLDANNNPKGLQFTCNDHEGNLTGEGARGADSTNDGISGWQGTASTSAGNIFNGGGTNIYNPGNEVSPITYYYNGTSPTIYGHVTRTTSGSNSCTEATEPDDNATPTDTHFGGQFGTTIRVLNMMHLTHPHLSDTTLNHPLSGSSHLSREQVYYNINYYLNDSLGMQHNDSAKFWLSQAQTPYTDLVYNQLLIDEGADSSDVYYGYDSIRYWYSLDSVETREYQWGRKLMGLKLAMRAGGGSTPMAVYQPDSAQAALLEQVADSANMWARIMAQDWLRAYDERTFDNPVLYPETGYDSTEEKPGRPNENPIGRVGNAAQENDKLYPNPVHELLFVNYRSKDGRAAMMTISDVTGRIVLQKELSTEEKPTVLNLGSLKAGIYFYRISEGGVTQVQGKVAKD